MLEEILQTFTEFAIIKFEKPNKGCLADSIIHFLYRLGEVAKKAYFQRCTKQ